MSFWNGNTEPLRKNRWSLQMDAAGLTPYLFALKKCDRPSYKTSDITHKFGNHNFYFPGRVEWNSINLTFASFPDLEFQLMKVLSDAGFSAPVDAPAALKGVSKTSFVNTVGKITLNQLNYKGEILEAWSLVNPFFTNIKFGDLSYDSEEIVDIECTIRYDTAILALGAASSLSNES